MADDGQADVEPRRAIRLLGHRAGYEGRLRPADWRGVRRERPDGLPGRHRQVLRAGAERVHVRRPGELGDLTGLFVRYGQRSGVAAWRAAGARLPESRWRWAGARADQPRL